MYIMRLQKSNLEKAEAFVESVEWIFAKTYAKTAPHEYIVKRYLPKEKWDEFLWFARLIREEGYDGKFYDHTYRYLDIDGKKYWTMDEDVEMTELINRCDVGDEYE